MFGLRKLMLVAKQKDLGHDDRMAAGMETIGLLWASVSRVRACLDQKLLPGESQADADAVIEDVIGKTWQLAELREKGCFVSNLSLFELAFERIDDESRQQRLEVSDMLDMGSGAVHQSIAFRPFKGLNQIPEQTSYQSPITVSEAAICPGFINRRLRWEKGIEQTDRKSARRLFEQGLCPRQNRFQGRPRAIPQPIGASVGPARGHLFPILRTNWQDRRPGGHPGSDGHADRNERSPKGLLERGEPRPCGGHDEQGKAWRCWSGSSCCRWQTRCSACRWLP